jgi:hypothetical protein
MITLSKLKSSTIENTKRILKVLQFGAKTAKEVSPFGFDSCPVEGLTAIFAETSNADESIIIGYIQADRLAQAGASRLFSIDPTTKELKAEIWLKTDGTITLNRGTKKAVLFEPLNQKLTDQNNAINTELLKIQASIIALGGTYSNTPLILDITTAKSESVFLK